MFATLFGVLLVVLTLTDCFESLVLAWRITRRWRPARLYYRSSWWLWRRGCQLIPAGRYRENTLSIFGPLSLFGSFACWVAVLIVGFALVHWGQESLPGELGSELPAVSLSKRRDVFHARLWRRHARHVRRQGGVGD